MRLRSTLIRLPVVFLLTALPQSAAAQSTAAQSPAASQPWLGVMLPPPLSVHELEVLADRPAAPAVVPTGEGQWTELAGAGLERDLATIVGFSHESRRTREIGEGMLWGRVTGFPSSAKTIAWAVDQFRAAGIADVELQSFQQTANAGITLPVSWEVRILADPSFGPGTRDVVLESAMPLSDTELPNGLTAPLVYVGTATPAELARVDLRGKVAVQKAIPQAHTVFIRDPVGPRAQDLMERGAVAVLTVIDLPGNMRVNDMGCGDGICFNVGGRDGLFLERVLDAATEQGRSDAVRVQLRVDNERYAGLSAANGVAVIPGRTRPSEYVVLNAHADAWFDGSGDNGDGLAVLVALARHFARPDMRQDRSIVFVASAGHHSTGLSGPGNFISMNQDIIDGAVLVVNLEHTAQRNVTPARTSHQDGYRHWTMDSYESPIVAGVSNRAPFVEDLVIQGTQRYGTNFVAGPNTTASGEGGSYSRTGVPVFTTIQGPPMYHTTGEVLEMVSTPGMERMARFMAWFVKEVSRAPASAIDPQ
jgi:hypothetical protein